MSIGTEISRIAAAVDDIKTAITGKGVPVSGTVKVDGLPELIEQISTGVDTSDATALASDIKVGKTAYVNGEKITGTIATSNGKNVRGNPSFSTPASGNQIAMSGSSTGGEIITPGALLRVYTPASNFGDATAEDVAKGKTFTSTAGLKVVGTMEAAQSNNNCEAYHITSESDVITFNGTGTIKVWGYATKKSTYTSALYAFVGDGYYSGASYDTPTKTSATFSIGSDGTLQGLPTGLTALDLLVEIGV